MICFLVAPGKVVVVVGGQVCMHVEAECLRKEDNRVLNGDYSSLGH